jgi:Tfp pilus assembly protein PilF
MLISIIIIPVLFSCATTQQKQVESKEDAKTYYQLGITHVQKGDFDQAILYFTKAIESDPKNPKAYNNRGGAYMAKGQYDRAISDFN